MNIKASDLCFKPWNREFPGSPVVRTRCFHCCDSGSIPGWGIKIPQTMWQGQKKKKKLNLGTLRYGFRRQWIGIEEYLFCF